MKDMVLVPVSELEHLKAVEDIYRRAYESSGACDISNFLALCSSAGVADELEYVAKKAILAGQNFLDGEVNNEQFFSELRSLQGVLEEMK